jgi:hypothetical protein
VIQYVPRAGPSHLLEMYGEIETGDDVRTGMASTGGSALLAPASTSIDGDCTPRGAFAESQSYVDIGVPCIKTMRFVSWKRRLVRDTMCLKTRSPFTCAQDSLRDRSLPLRRVDEPLVL